MNDITPVLTIRVVDYLHFPMVVTGWPFHVAALYLEDNQAHVLSDVLVFLSLEPVRGSRLVAKLSNLEVSREKHT